jgi:glycosyltransferase involved in cell wall biosynthesis
MGSIRVLHITEILSGGTASYLEEVLPYQVGRLGGENVILLAPDQDAAHVPPLFAGKRELYRRTGRNLTSLARLWRAAQKCIAQHKPNIVHLHCSLAGGVVRLLLACRRQKPAVVYCAHAWAFSRTTGIVPKQFYATIERLLGFKTNMIVNVSDSDFNIAANIGLPREKMIVVRNGISIVAPRIDSPIVWDQNKINLLFVGRHDPQKGLDLLITAMNQVVGFPVHLHVLGSGILSSGAKRNTDFPNITFYGWVPRDRVSAYIDAADAVIMPSRWEGLSLVAIEAMRMARPVIASSCDGFTGVIIDGETGILFPPDNSQAIAETLKSLDTARLRSMRPLALRHFEQNFTANRMNAQLLELYEDLVEIKSSTALVDAYGDVG